MTHTLDLKKTLPWILYVIFFAVLNETVFNVSTPAISKQFHLSPTGLGWMMTIFMLFFGVATVIFGRLSDLYSLKRLIIIGIVIYAVGSLLGFILQFSYPLILCSRAIQGIGAASIPALVMVVVIRFFEPSERGKIFGYIGSTASTAVGIGPILGGYISGTFHWTYLFLIPVLALIAIPFLNRLLPSEKSKPGSVDLLGATLLSLFVGSLVLLMTYPEKKWLIAALVTGLLFVVRILFAKEPFIRPQLFSIAPFRNGSAISFLLFSVIIGTFFFLPLYLSQLKNLSTNQIGLVLFPGAALAIFLGPYGGKIADQKGNHTLMTLGLGFLLAGMTTAALLLPSSVWILAAVFLLFYIGFAFLQTAITNTVSMTLPEAEAGTGMGLYNLITIISGAFGMAMTAKLLDSGLLHFPVLSSNEIAWSYQNLFLLFALFVLVAGVWYFLVFKKSPHSPGSASH